MHALAKHLMLELRDCNRETLDDVEAVRELLLEAARRLGVTIIGDSFHRFEPQGISGIVFVAESHLSIHTWPEHGYAALDVFTCGDWPMEAVADFLISGLEARSPALLELRRGVLPVAARVP